VLLLWISSKFFQHEFDLKARLFGLTGVVLAILSWLPGHKFIPAIHNRRVRTAIGAMCCLASVGGILLYIILGVPFFVAHHGPENAEGPLFVSFLWVSVVMAILGGMAYGLEKAARKNNQRYV
jgi:hypothetical protein